MINKKEQKKALRRQIDCSVKKAIASITHPEQANSEIFGQENILSKPWITKRDASRSGRVQLQ
jgi:hypothetical protein